MPDHNIKTVSIIGLGALGILYAGKLQAVLPENGLRIIADRERIQRYRSQGVFCNGQPCRFHYVTPEEPVSPAELVLICTKSTGLDQAVSAIAGHVGTDTTLMSAINGITSEEIIAKAYGPERVIYAVAQNTDATRVGTSLRREGRDRFPPAAAG